MYRFQSDDTAKRTGQSLDGLLWLIAGLLILLLILGFYLLSQESLAKYQEAKKRAEVSAVRNDLRTLAVAVESYFIDCSEYPTMEPLRAWPHDEAALAAAGGSDLTTIKHGFDGRAGRDDPFGITSPIAYVSSSVTIDPFSPGGELPYAYYADFPDQGQEGRGRRVWMFYSPGPDRHYDLDPARDIDWTQSHQGIIARLRGGDFVFDPTNGANSSGDIVRTPDW